MYKQISEPSLHDEIYEKYSENSFLREKALEDFAELYKSNILVDARNEHYEEIDNLMEGVFDKIYSDIDKSTQFARLAFKQFSRLEQGDCPLYKMIEMAMDAVIEEKFEASMKKQDDE
jgi:uncharacterized protein (UPF0128 family)